MTGERTRLRRQRKSLVPYGGTCRDFPSVIFGSDS